MSNRDEERRRAFERLTNDDERLMYAESLTRDARHLQALGYTSRANGKAREARDLLDLMLED